MFLFHTSSYVFLVDQSIPSVNTPPSQADHQGILFDMVRVGKFGKNTALGKKSCTKTLLQGKVFTCFQ